MHNPYQSNAEWPAGTITGKESQISTDTHSTRQAAESVCRMLERDGFGGEGKIFPLRTWVSDLIGPWSELEAKPEESTWSVPTDEDAKPGDGYRFATNSRKDLGRQKFSLSTDCKTWKEVTNGDLDGHPGAWRETPDSQYVWYYARLPLEIPPPRPRNNTPTNSSVRTRHSPDSWWRCARVPVPAGAKQTEGKQ